MGIISELQKLGVTLLLADVQRSLVHFSDAIFFRDKRLEYRPIDEAAARVIRCGESRDFLDSMGICGEIIHTPSHSEDSVSVILDEGICIVGDLEPMEYLAAYNQNLKLERDWEQLMLHHTKRIHYAHANEKEICWKAEEFS